MIIVITSVVHCSCIEVCVITIIQISILDLNVVLLGEASGFFLNAAVLLCKKENPADCMCLLACNYTHRRAHTHTHVHSRFCHCPSDPTAPNHSLSYFVSHICLFWLSQSRQSFKLALLSTSYHFVFFLSIFCLLERKCVCACARVCVCSCSCVFPLRGRVLD